MIQIIFAAWFWYWVACSIFHIVRGAVDGARSAISDQKTITKEQNSK